MSRAAGEVNVAVMNDSDEKGRLDQAKMLGINRGETLGQLSTGFIHSLNNTLGVLFGYMELAMDEGEADSPLVEYVRLATHSAEKARLLVEQLHGFSRQGSDAELRVDLVKQSEGALALAQSVFPCSIRFECRWPDQPVWVRLRPPHWRQILLNLLLNAKEAMPEGGLITLSLEQTGETTCRFTVADQGPGMSPELKARALEPFFTTKAPGQGSGLGLTAARVMIEQMGGGLELDSQAGGGTEVHLRLPLASSSGKGCL